MANRYSPRDQGQQGYLDDDGYRQQDQFEQRSGGQYGDSYGSDYDDRGYRSRSEARYSQSDRSRMIDRGDERGRSYGGRSSRASGSYDPFSDYDRDDGRMRGRSGQRERSFRGDYDTRDSDRGRDWDRNRGSYSERSRYGSSDYSPYERDRDDRGFFDRAGDEIASWFGDDDAERRREMDYRRQSNHRARHGESHRGRGPKNYNRSDERMLEDACERLTHDHGVDARDVEVSVKDGELTLDGKVNTRWEKRRAEDCVHDMSGINHVQNNLRIRETDMRAGSTETDRTTKSRTDTTSGTLA